MAALVREVALSVRWVSKIRYMHYYSLTSCNFEWNLFFYIRATQVSKIWPKEKVQKKLFMVKFFADLLFVKETIAPRQTKFGVCWEHITPYNLITFIDVHWLLLDISSHKCGEIIEINVTIFWKLFLARRKKNYFRLIYACLWYKHSLICHYCCKTIVCLIKKFITKLSFEKSLR